jgi:uncharacterized protein (DUF1015 family)
MLYDEDKHLGNENLNYFMSFLIAESQVKIYEFNRIIRDLNGYSKDDFLEKLSEHFIIKDKEQEIDLSTEPIALYTGIYSDIFGFELTIKD